MNAPDNIKAAQKGAASVELPLMTAAQPAEMTPKAARDLLINGTKDFDRIFPPESAAEAVAQAVTTPAQRADATIAKFKARGERFPPGTAGAVLCGEQSADEAEAVANEQALAIDQDDAGELAGTDAIRARRISEGERGIFWGVPPQREIRVSTISDGNIEIEEVSPLGSDDDTRIIVAETNAVRFARSVLFAAGFRSILIATGDGGSGYTDLDDGATASQFGEDAR